MSTVALDAANVRADARRRDRSRDELAMWIFLTTETLFFGVLFFSYLVLRLKHPDAFAAASKRTDVVLGTINTAVLLTSSVSMALAVRAASIDRRRLATMLLAATAALGLAFLVIKGVEYRKEYLEHLVAAIDFRFAPRLAQGAEAFFWLYFVMTGFHALHLSIGVALVGVIAARLARKGFAAQSATSIEIAGLYWHFVDVVWIFMYPCLYLVSRT